MLNISLLDIQENVVFTLLKLIFCAKKRKASLHTNTLLF